MQFTGTNHTVRIITFIKSRKSYTFKVLTTISRGTFCITIYSKYDYFVQYLHETRGHAKEK